MGRIFCMMGKSATGKDTVYKELLTRLGDRIRTVCPYTTRPVRDGETEGVEYHFVDVPSFMKMRESGKVIESRVYHTVYGDWYYFTADDGQIDTEKCDYLLIMTLEGYKSLSEYYGKDRVVPIYIEVDDGLRLERAVKRERQQKNPKYTELCRRFLADAEDFSEDKLAATDGLVRIVNENLEDCVENVVKLILG